MTESALSPPNATATYLDRNPSAARIWRAHQWMCEAASAEQIAVAVSVASETVDAMSEEGLATMMAEHNRDRAAVDMPAVAADEFKDLFWALYIHLELLKSFASGTGH